MSPCTKSLFNPHSLIQLHSSHRLDAHVSFFSPQYGLLTRYRVSTEWSSPTPQQGLSSSSSLANRTSACWSTRGAAGYRLRAMSSLRMQPSPARKQRSRHFFHFKNIKTISASCFSSRNVIPVANTIQDTSEPPCDGGSHWPFVYDQEETFHNYRIALNSHSVVKNGGQIPSEPGCLLGQVHW